MTLRKLLKGALSIFFSDLRPSKGNTKSSKGKVSSRVSSSRGSQTSSNKNGRVPREAPKKSDRIKAGVTSQATSRTKSPVPMFDDLINSDTESTCPAENHDESPPRRNAVNRSSARLAGLYHPNRSGFQERHEDLSISGIKEKADVFFSSFC